MTPEGCACADIPLPDEEARKELFKIAMKGVGIDDGVDMDRLARETEGYSGDDVANVCRDGRVWLRVHAVVNHASRHGGVARRAAAMMSMRKALVAARKAGLNATQLRNHMSKATEDVAAPVTENDFLDALKKVQSSVSGSDLKRFENWMETYGSI